MRHTVTFQNSEFEIVVIDNNICLQSADRDIIFENGYNECMRQLTKEWERQQMRGKLRDYQLEYEIETILQYIKDNETRAIELIHK